MKTNQDDLEKRVTHFLEKHIMQHLENLEKKFRPLLRIFLRLLQIIIIAIPFMLGFSGAVSIPIGCFIGMICVMSEFALNKSVTRLLPPEKAAASFLKDARTLLEFGAKMKQRARATADAPSSNDQKVRPLLQRVLEHYPATQAAKEARILLIKLDEPESVKQNIKRVQPQNSPTAGIAAATAEPIDKAATGPMTPAAGAAAASATHANVGAVRQQQTPQQPTACAHCGAKRDAAEDYDGTSLCHRCLAERRLPPDICASCKNKFDPSTGRRTRMFLHPICESCYARLMQRVAGDSPFGQGLAAANIVIGRPNPRK
jgi:hypothetical protein